MKPYIMLSLLVCFSACHKETSTCSYDEDMRQLVEQLVQQQTKISALEAQITDMQSDRAAWHAIGQYLREEQGDLIISGANLKIISGSGETAGSVNGTGNLIIGYDENTTDSSTDAQKTGSHNLIVGPGHTYTSCGAIIGGLDNVVKDKYGTVIGGARNIVTKQTGVVVGGRFNQATALGSVVVGGSGNEALHDDSVVVGGDDNVTSTVFDIVP